MPEPGSEADEAVRDARQAVYRVDQGRQLASQQVAPMSDDLNLEAALDAYEAAIRASERAKWDAVKQGYVDAAATIEAEFRHYRERFEPIMEEAVASERERYAALVAAAERFKAANDALTELHEREAINSTKTDAEWAGLVSDAWFEHDRARDALYAALRALGQPEEVKP